MRTLSELPYKQKREVVQWWRIPDIICDLNFRPPAWHPRGKWHSLVIWLIGLSLGSATVGVFVRMVLGWFVGSAVVAIPFSLAGSFAGLCLVTLPVVCVTADRLATHFVFWMTAHFRIDRATMLGWRADWRERLVRFPHRPPRRPEPTLQVLQTHQQVLRLRDDYLAGFARFTAALVIPAVVVAGAGLLDVIETVGPTIVAGQLAALVCLAVTTVPRDAAPVFAQALEHFFGSGHNQPTTPWMFPSPCGRSRARQLWLVLSACLLSLTLLPIACTFTVTAHPAAGLDSSSGIGEARRSAWVDDWLVPAVHAVADGRFQHVGDLLLLLLAAGLLPPALLLLGLYVITGRVLVAHDRALERRGAYEQHHQWTPFDGYTERLRHSRDRRERDCLMIGFISFNR